MPDLEVNMESAVESMSADLFPDSTVVEDSDVSFDSPDNIKDDVVEPVKEAVQEAESTDVKPEEEKAPVVAPLSWKKDMAELYGALEAPMQDYIKERENQMKEGLEKDRGDANLGRLMRDTMSPYSDMLKRANIDEPTAIKALLGNHFQMMNASPEQKNALLHKYAKSYGVTMDGAPTPNAEMDALRGELNGIKQHLSTAQQKTLQDTRAKVSSDIEKFAKDHEHFDDLSDDIAKFIQAGYELNDAYDAALWANPVTRQAELERQSKEKATEDKAKAKQEAADAKKAKAVNIKNRDTDKTPTAPKGTMEDTMRDTFREIQNRN